MKKRIAIGIVLCVLLTLCACTQQRPKVDPASLRGTTVGNVYENEFLKLRCTLPDGWSYYGDEGLAEAGNVTKELFDSEDVQTLIEKNGIFFDMIFTLPDGSMNCNLNFTRNDHQADNLDDQTLYTRMESDFREQVAAAGMNVSSYTVETLQFCGEERACIHAEYEDLGLNQYTIYLRNGSDYQATLTMTIIGEGTPEQMLGFFTRLP